MILQNKLTFGGEVVKITDFGDNKGGNIIICGASKHGDVKLSVLLNEQMFRQICDKDFPKVVIQGHIEQRTHETDGGNLKHSLRYVADELKLAL